MNKKIFLSSLTVLLFVIILSGIYTINSSNSKTVATETKNSNFSANSLKTSLSSISQTNVYSNSTAIISSVPAIIENSSITGESESLSIKTDNGNYDGQLVIPSTNDDIKAMDYSGLKG